MYAIDAYATHTINGLLGFAWLDALMVAASTFGVPLIVLAVAIQWWVGQDRAHVRHAVVASGLSFLLGLGINQVVLLFVQRVRPYDMGLTHLLIERSADWSFPSDHATATVAVAATFLLHSLPKRDALFLCAAALVCLSRVYIGTHYASDVLGGAATGLVAAGLVAAVYREGTRIDRRITAIL